MDLFDPTSDCEAMYHGEEVLAKFLEAGCQPSHVLQLTEEPLDDVALGVEIGVVRDRFSRIAL